MTDRSEFCADITAEKKVLRVKALKARRALKVSFDDRMAKAVVRAGLDLIETDDGPCVSLYYPESDEIDCLPLLDALSRAGCETALPLVVGRNQPLEFRAWKVGDALEDGVFDVAVPQSGARLCAPDILLVPLLAFDKLGFRLGYGGGFYDRTLQMLRAQGKVTAIGLGFAGQEVAVVPRHQYDEPCDWILSENGARKMNASA